MGTSRHLLAMQIWASLILVLAFAFPAYGDATSLSTGQEVQLNSVETGDQFAVGQMTGSEVFADQTVNLTEFSGVFGQSSDTAYILVASGMAEVNGARAKAGQVLMILPYGVQTVVQRYDAARFVNSWSSQAISANPELHAQLSDVAKHQKRAIFWGRYDSTNFNVTAPGSRSEEMARRSVVGAGVISDIRFSTQNSQESLQRVVVDKFVQALASGDEKTVATLFDPTPFGASDLRGGAAGARLIMAQKLLASNNWSTRLQSTQLTPVGDTGVWRARSGENVTEFVLKPIGDFTFIQSVSLGS